MSRPRISSELQEAASLLGAVTEDVRRRSSPLQGRGDRLQRLLAQMCARAQFRGAAIADDQGLPLAVHNLPFRAEALGAIASVLGGALATVAKVTERPELPTIAVDVTFDEKLVVRRVVEADLTYYLLVLCPIAGDERGEIELSLRQLTTIVARS